MLWWLESLVKSALSVAAHLGIFANCCDQHIKSPGVSLAKLSTDSLSSCLGQGGSFCMTHTICAFCTKCTKGCIILSYNTPVPTFPWLDGAKSSILWYIAIMLINLRRKYMLLSLWIQGLMDSNTTLTQNSVDTLCNGKIPHLEWHNLMTWQLAGDWPK